MQRATISARRARAPLAATAALALLSTGCFQSARDFSVDGVHVQLDEIAADAPFARDPSFPARLERMMRLGARYWSGSEDLAPWRPWALRFEATMFDCGSLQGHATGCTDHVNHVMGVSTKDLLSYRGKWQVPCVEVTQVIHEMGHALIGDGGHRDRRWREFGPLYHEVLFPDDGSVDLACQFRGWTETGGYDGEWDG